MLKHMTHPLKPLPKDKAIEKVVEFMDSYSISQEGLDSMMAMFKFQEHPSPLDDVHPVVKAALTKANNKGNKSRVIHLADMITLSGIKKATNK
ncbi:replication factor C subunit 1 [Tanacetum coccineum]